MLMQLRILLFLGQVRLSISELCVLSKAAILVPSPNVTEDHQRKNAMALVDKKAALMLEDKEVKEYLLSV